MGRPHHCGQLPNQTKVEVASGSVPVEANALSSEHASVPETYVVDDSPNAHRVEPDNQLGLTPPPETQAAPTELEQPTPFQERLDRVSDSPKEVPSAEPASEAPPSEAPPSEAPASEAPASEVPSGDTPQNDEDIFGDELPPVFLSTAAAQARLRRCCQPNAKGEYKVPKQVLDKFRDVKGGRKELEKMFEKCGHDPGQG